MKITLATFKSFIRKNQPNLQILCESSFDGMTDCIERNVGAAFHPIHEAKTFHSNNLGISGLWLVGNSRDWFSSYENDRFTGIEWSNCCGSGIIAISK